MYLKYSIGFIIASLVQAAIVFATESAGISSLNAPFTITQLLTHIIVGQIAGFILVFAANRSETISRANVWLVGAAYGTILWWLLLTINSALGTVRAPWSQDMATVLSSLLAFVAYGVISDLVIKRYGHRYIHA